MYGGFISEEPLSARLSGVCDAVYREFLFGMGPCAWGEFQSYPFSCVSRVCSRCYRERSSNFVLGRLSSTQPGVPSISQRAIVRNTSASEATKTAQDQPGVEAPPRPAATAMVSGHDEPATQTEEDHQTEVHSQKSRKHSRVVTRSHEPYWRRPFAHAFSPSPRFW